MEAKPAAVDSRPREPRTRGSQRLGAYLRRLRVGYGYSLRRVEERARAEGGEIDNSQLSRYEKGLCYPSFDKLRVLASVFNVPIQTFSDVVDLEAFEHLKPETSDPDALMEAGTAALKKGEVARAFACYERALEVLQEAPGKVEHAVRIARARLSLASALYRLGKLSLAEQELRHALRTGVADEPLFQAQLILTLANVHADQGDWVLAELEAERAHEIARAAGHELLAARALHTVARVLADQGRHLESIERYRQAAALYEKCGETHEAVRVRVNIGGCYVGTGRLRESLRLLRAAMLEARAGGYRRQQARAWSFLGEAHYKLGELDKARRCFKESDALAGIDEAYPDILFLNAYYTWRMAQDTGNTTAEKIAFGRLKALRSRLERRFPEIDAFDAQIERGRSDA